VSEHSDAIERLRQIDLLLELRRYEEAADRTSRALANAPDDCALLCRLTLTQLGLNDLGGALESAQRAMAAGPIEEWPHRLASIIRRRSGQYREAVEEARSAVSLAPLTWQGHLCLAQALLSETPDRTESLAEARRAVELAPDRAETHQVLGQVQAAAGSTRAAEKSFRDALAIDPQNPSAHNELARMRLRGAAPLFGSSQLAAAAGGFASAVQIDPRAGYGRRNLEIAVGTFIYRLAYLLFLVSAVGFSLLAKSTTLAARVTPALLLLVPLGFASRFAVRLSPSLRLFLLQYVRQPRGRSVAVILECCTAVLILASAFFESPARKHLLQLGGGCSLAAIVILVVMTRSSSLHRTATPAGMSPPPAEPRAVLGAGVSDRYAARTGVQRDYSRPPQVRSSYLWLLLVALAIPTLGAFAVLVAPVPAAGRAAGGATFLLLLAACGALARSIRRRAPVRS
jgi:tetratricopeptide (TPR) repeat protein